MLLVTIIACSNICACYLHACMSVCILHINVCVYIHKFVCVCACVCIVISFLQGDNHIYMLSKHVWNSSWTFCVLQKMLKEAQQKERKLNAELRQCHEELKTTKVLCCTRHYYFIMQLCTTGLFCIVHLECKRQTWTNPEGLGGREGLP